MMLRTKDEQKAYLDGYEMCAECIENYLTDEGKQKLECLLMAVRNAVGIEALEQEPILDKIRAEIEQMDFDFGDFYDHTDTIVEMVLQVIDKYRKRGE